MPDRKRRSVLGIVFLTVFLDMVGFSIIFPLFPGMLEHYLALEGEGSLIAGLQQALSGLADSDWAVVTLFGGVLGSLYSLLQFLFAPVWGALSDRHGRRPVLLITLTGTTLSYLVWIMAGNFALLIVARLVGGIMAGNLSTASAAIADTHSGSERAKGMGMMGAGIGLGFVIGPAIGGLLARWSGGLDWAAHSSFGLNPFSGCAAVALGLSLLNLVWAARRFPETLPPEKRGVSEVRASARHPFRTLTTIDRPGVRATSVAYFVYFAAFGAMEFTLVFLAHERLGFDERDNALMFVFIGLTIAVVQGGLVRRLAPRHGERRLAALGMALTVPGFVLVGSAECVPMLYGGLACLAVGSAFVMPCMSALVSRYSPAERQGLAMGVFRSLGSLARAIGPIAGGLLYWKLGGYGPYYVGAAVAVIPLWMALRLPAPPEDPPGDLPEVKAPKVKADGI
jgi:MFS family permease